MSPQHKKYIGRFAPSPSGPLHLGSLACALASYLDAKANGGDWLVRIEDIDPPREQAGADKIILDSLLKHGLQWDNDVRYQSERSAHYHDALSHLRTQGLTYRCDCTRKRLREAVCLLGYDGHCRLRDIDPSSPAAIRVNTTKALANLNQLNSLLSFHDLIQGNIAEDISVTGDFIIHRKDGLFAYQLAVSVDDIDQHVTHIVRGSDLLETTIKQQLIIRLLGAKPPEYAHIPVLSAKAGFKLSKQNHAPALNNSDALNNLKRAAQALLLPEPPQITSIGSFLSWATEQWDLAPLTGQLEIIESSIPP